MPRKKDNLRTEIKSLLSTSLEGRRIKVIFHPDSSIMSLGEIDIVGETRGTLMVKCHDGEYRLVPKAPNARFQFEMKHGKVTLPGTRLIGTPKQRRKQKLSKW
ncbi:MAG: hypothetical protein D6732_06550 [Methanobacteriota archaeon]|nr:MAG: hypothetical protein D6732_06550 [Euryarchaeota archaeon]